MLISSGVNDFGCSSLFLFLESFHILVLSFLHLFLFLSLSPVDQSGSVGSGVPLVNSIRIDSALIGGTKLLYLCIFFTGLYLAIFHPCSAGVQAVTPRYLHFKRFVQHFQQRFGYFCVRRMTANRNWPASVICWWFFFKQQQNCFKDRTADISVRVICGGKLDTRTATVENGCFIMSIVLPLTKNNEISCAFLVPFYFKKKWWVQANQVVERGWTPRKSKVVCQAGVHLKLI